MYTKQQLIDDLKSISIEREKWNKNPFLPYEYIESLIKSHIKLHDMLDAHDWQLAEDMLDAKG